MTGATGYGVPEWVAVAPGEVDHMLGLLTADISNSATPARVSYLKALLWTVGDGAAPVTGRPDQPVTVEAAEVEWWSALAAVKPETAHLAPLREISAQLGVAYRCPNVVALQVSDATWMVLSWLLGLQDPQGPHGLPAWFFQGPTPTADELFRKATAADTAQGVARSPSHWAAVYRRAQQDAVRHRRMAMRMREIEHRRSDAVT